MAALLRNQASVQDLVVEASIEQSKDLALQALLADPCVDGIEQAQKILAKMMRIQSKFLHLN